MDIRSFKAGKQQKGFNYQYFMPESINHTFTWQDAELNELLEQASLKAGELNAFAHQVPDASMFIKMHVYKEAVVSSRIEGTQTHIEEAFLDIKDIKPERKDDWQEVNNYVHAMNHAIKELDKLPLSNRLFRQLHGILMKSVRGEKKTPGEFRRSQNWIGGATLNDAVFVPPAHEHVPDLMADLEKFIHNTDIKVPRLIKAAIAHYQFETIHPFLDGNGRLGRLLITLYLVDTKVMDKPLLYLSDFFEKNRHLYYDNLTVVRRKNDLRQWLLFFLVAVRETAEKAAATLQEIIGIKVKLEKTFILSMGRRAAVAQRFLDSLFSDPVITSKTAALKLKLTPKATNKMIEDFIAAGILKEITGLQRGRVYAFHTYINLFEK
jgi:Fic family protein